MTASLATRVGWCPGALRPMASRDGYIVRVKPRCATLSPAQAIGIAAAARAFGNGALELTSHANLQIRGANDASLPALTDALDRLGLLDRDAGAEARRNVVSSPLAGLDPTAVLDIRPVGAALEDRLTAATGLSGLPAKFGFAVSDGGCFSRDDVGADVTFAAAWRSRPETGRAARSAGSGEAGGAAGFMVRLAGAEDVAAFCPARSVPDVAIRLAGWFIAARGADADLRRMRHAVAWIGAAAILSAVGLMPEPSWPGSSRPPTPSDGPRPGETDAGNHGVGCFSLGAGVGGRDEPGHNDRVGLSRDVLGVAAPFGRLGAAQLDGLARGALRAGARELRLTPWRSVLIPGLTRAAAVWLAEESGAAGLIVDPADPRLRVAACAGAPGCHRGTTPVLDHAARWARLLGKAQAGDKILLHVSGCAKGCAHAGNAPLTLVAEDGRYRVVSDGIPGAAGLDADAVARLLEAVSGSRPT